MHSDFFHGTLAKTQLERKYVFKLVSINNPFFSPPHVSSSLPSEQCLRPSQRSAELMHVGFALWHWKPSSRHLHCSGIQLDILEQFLMNGRQEIFDNKPHKFVVSSLSSVQSASPSQTQSHGIHCSLVVVQLKVFWAHFIGSKEEKRL